MKKLLLIRHAKATHDNDYQDFERPLKHSGLQDAVMIAKRLKENGIAPQIMITSPAVRAQSTANIIVEHLSLAQPQTDMNIYDATQAALLTLVTALPDDFEFIGLAGHNPGFSELLAYLTNDFREMPTCAAALISFDADTWQEITHGSGKITYYTAP